MLLFAHPWAFITFNISQLRMRKDYTGEIVNLYLTMGKNEQEDPTDLSLPGHFF